MSLGFEFPETAPTIQVMTRERKGLVESGRLIVEAAADGAPRKYRAVLISQGQGSSGFYGAEFFTAANAEALADALSFPGHPEDSWRPDRRDPLSAIAWTGPQVEIEQEENGLWRFVSDYVIPESREDVAKYLEDFGARLGLSIYIEGEGEYNAETGNWHVLTIDGSDPYKSVDLVVAAGRGGKLLQAAEGLRRLEGKTPAPAAENNKEKVMDEEKVKALVAASIAEALEPINARLTTLAEAAKPAEQTQEEGAQALTAEEKLDKYAADLDLINEAGLTETQVGEAKDIAKAGGDVAAFIEKAAKVVSEARAPLVESGKPGGVRHVGGSTITESAEFGVSGFGKVR